MNYKQRFSKIKHFMFDMDGVLTNGRVLLESNQKQSRELNVKDAYAIHVSLHSGFTVHVISGGFSEPVKLYLESLGVRVFMNIRDKLDCVIKIETQFNINPTETLYMGDDGPDIPVLQHVGCATCPNDAGIDTKSAVHYISPFNGGFGCVRDVIEQVCKSQNAWKLINW